MIKRPLLALALLLVLTLPALAQQDLRLAGDLCFPTRTGQTLRNVGAIGNPRDPRAGDWQRTLGDQLRIGPRGPEVTLAGWTWPGNAVALAILMPQRAGVRVLGVWEDCFGPLGCELAITDQQSGPPAMIVVESRCNSAVDDPRARRPRIEVRRHIVAIGIRADRAWLAGEVELDHHPEARVHLDDRGRTLVITLSDGETRLPLDLPGGQRR